MNVIVNQLLIPDGKEFVIFDRDLIIVETSSAANRFAHFPEEVLKGKDIRQGFPEIEGVEDIMQDILDRKRENFALKGINRSLDAQNDLYVDFLFTCFEDCLLLWLEDTTKIMILEQSLVQRANETEILLSALSISQDYLNKIIGSMGDALLVTTESGNIKKVNQVAEQLFGYPQGELLGQSIFTIIENLDLVISEIYEKPLRYDTFIQTIELNCRTKLGNKISVEFSCSAVNSDIEGVFDYIYVGRDITLKKRAEEEMLKALQKEQEFSELKSRFISMASHEFRNPLATIILCLQLLEELKELEEDERNNLNQENQKYLNYARKAAKNMQGLVEDIILFNQSEIGNLSIQTSLVNLEKLCLEIIGELEVATQQQRIVFFSNGGGREAKIDEKLVRYILNNVLSNALKYSHPNTTINLELLCSTEENTAIFTVRDRGIGIPKEDLSNLFDSFYRARNVGDVSGSGLGLSIVKKSVDLHKGKIAIKSEVGVGTTVTITLPLNVY